MIYVTAIAMFAIGITFLAIGNRAASGVGWALVLIGVWLLNHAITPNVAKSISLPVAIEKNINEIEIINKRLDAIERVLEDKLDREQTE